MKYYKLLEFIKKIEKVFSTEIAEEWDNVGLQVAKENKIIKKIILTVDVLPEIIEYSYKNQFDLIISHHPLIFSPLKKFVVFNDYLSLSIFQLLKYNIALYVMHTNLDKLYFKKLSSFFNLKNIKPLTPNNKKSKFAFASYGEYKKEIKFKELLEEVKEKLNISHLKYIGDLEKKVKRIAFCGGAGADFINKNLKELNIDVLVTSDIKHHNALNAYNLGIGIIDAGHYHTEKILLPELKNSLSKIFPELYFEISNIETDALKYF